MHAMAICTLWCLLEQFIECIPSFIVLSGVSESTDESTSKRPKAYRKLGLYMRADVMIISKHGDSLCRFEVT